MRIEYFHGFLDWVAGGAGAASLALFIFVPTLTEIDASYQNYATHLFLAAIPFLICSSALSREISSKNKSTEKADMILTALVGLGALLLLIGLICLCIAMGNKLLGTLGITFGISLTLYQRASKSILN